MTEPTPFLLIPADWKRVAIFGALIAAIGFGAATLAVPSWRGKAPIVRQLIQRSDKLCLVLEGEDREACATLASVASALARPLPAPSSSSVTPAMGSGGSPL